MITLQEIKTTQNKLAEMIANFEVAQKTTFSLSAAEIELAPGERYAGIILGKEGSLGYHLVLMEGEAADVNWKEANDWIAKRNDGASLPTRREQALLYANLKEEFEEAYYWSAEEHATSSDSAWYQHFNNGGQNSSRKCFSLRARAVRRLPC
jgi:hypothetical protein